MCLPAEQIPKSIAPVIGKASATNPLQLPGRSASPVPVGREESGLLIGPAWRRAGSQPWLRTQKHNASSSHPIGPGRGHTAFMSLLSWQGGEKQYFRAPGAGRRKERLLCFQACVTGEAASVGAFPSWSLQLPHSTVTQTTDPMSPDWVSVRGQMCAVGAPRPPFFCDGPHRELLPG